MCIYIYIYVIGSPRFDNIMNISCNIIYYNLTYSNMRIYVYIYIYVLVRLLYQEQCNTIVITTPPTTTTTTNNNNNNIIMKILTTTIHNNNSNNALSSPFRLRAGGLASERGDFGLSTW